MKSPNQYRSIGIGDQTHSRVIDPEEKSPNGLIKTIDQRAEI